jgi:hypothetical protein
VNASTCAVCTQPIDWTGVAWKHPTTAVWASTPVRHQASSAPCRKPGRRRCQTARIGMPTGHGAVTIAASVPRRQQRRGRATGALWWSQHRSS